MSAEEFWEGDVRLAQAYREAEKIRRENAYVREWRFGIYVREALISAAPAYREFSKGAEYRYPDQPLFSTRDIHEVEEEKEKAQMELMLGVFNARASKINESLNVDETTGDK